MQKNKKTECVSVMKKKISLLLALTMILTILPMNIASASASAETTSPSYLVADFEDGIVGNNDGKTFNLVDGPGAAKYAVQVTDGSKYPTFDFCLLGSLSGATEYYNGEKVNSKRVYDVSAWIRTDSAVTSDKVDFLFTMNSGSVNYTHTVNNAGLVRGEWVKVKTTIEYTGSHTPSVGTVGVKVSDGIAYSMDDLTLICRRYKPLQGQGINPVNASPLGGQTSLGTSTANAVNGWYAIGGTTSMTTSYTGNEISLGDSQTEKISGKTAVVKGTNGSAQIVCSTINIKYGTTYTVYFLAKADNEATIGNNLYLIFSRANRDDTENLTSKFLYVSPTSVLPAGDDTKITGEWRRYAATFTYSDRTYNTKLPNMSICVRKSGSDYIEGGLPEFSIANFRIYQQTGSEHAGLYPTGSLNVIDSGNNCFSVSGNSATTLGEVTNTITRITAPYGDDYVIIKSVDAWENNFAFNLQCDEPVDEGRFKMFINAKDKDNYFGVEATRESNEIKSKTSAFAEFDQSVWASDMPTLSATVEYNAPSGNDKLLALCSMYDANNKMVSHDVKEIDLVNGEGTQSLTMNTVADAVKARVFLWETGAYAPIIGGVCEITKTTNANFVYVDPVNGTNNQIYGYYEPVKTLDQALAAITRFKTSSPKDTYIFLMPGDHQVTSTLAMKPAMTTANYNIMFTSYNKNNKAVITGGTDLTGKFEKYQGNIWRAPVPVGTEARQFYVDGVKATVARSRDLTADEFTNTSTFKDGSLVTLGELSTANSEHVAMMKKINASGRINDVEMVFFSLWTNPRAQVASITENDDGSVTFVMDSPAWKSVNNKGSSHVYTPKYYENALELLDEGNEWYLDSEGGYVYYWPRNGVNIGGNSKAVLATFDAYEKPLMTVTGTSSMPIRNVTFDNLVFADVTWTRPSTTNGHADAQNNHLRDIGDVLPEGVIDVKYANNVNFTNNKFTRLGTTALRFLDGTKNSNIIGNEFYDLSSGAINVGDPSTAPAYRYPTETNKLEYIRVENNYIHNVARDHWSAAAISAGNPANTTFSHNEICNIPYSAFHIGYGWDSGIQSTENEDGSITATHNPTCAVNLDITDNYIHDLFQGTIYDGGAIYTNGISGGTAENRSLISRNYITDIGPGAAFLYNDQGSTYYEVSHNVCDNSNIWGEYDVTTGKWKGPSGWMNVNLSKKGFSHGLLWHTNYAVATKYYVGGTAAVDTSNRFDTAILQDASTGEWCDAAKAIIANAGIQAEYAGNFRKGLQKLEVTKELNLKVGDSFSNVPRFVTSKRDTYKSNELVTYESSSNSRVATVTNGIITAVSAGTAEITYTVIENGVMYKGKTTVVVE